MIYFVFLWIGLSLSALGFLAGYLWTLKKKGKAKVLRKGNKQINNELYEFLSYDGTPKA